MRSKEGGIDREMGLGGAERQRTKTGSADGRRVEEEKRATLVYRRN